MSNGLRELVQLPNEMTPQLKSADTQLAQAIVKKLVDERLLLPNRAEDALRKIHMGEANSSDWKLWAKDFTTKEETKNG